MTARRTDKGGIVDRDKPVAFTWDNRHYSGYSGDTLASALMANGERIVGRSFKYHRPRGVMSAGVEESGALVTIGVSHRRDANVKATMQELYEGLIAHGQNAWPNVRRDVGAVNNLMSRFFAAGFYYKTFMGIPPMEWGRKGTGIWMQYEKLIRRAAGMGRASRDPDPDHYEHGHLFCDVLVVGSGPAGLAAAKKCAEQGLDVLLVEQDFEFGGDYLNQGGTDAAAKRKALVDSIEQAGGRLMNRTTAFGLYDYGVAGLLQRVTDHIPDPDVSLPRQRFLTVRAKHTILATGALERHYAFGNNDLPGIMNAHAADCYLNRFGVLAGEKVVISANNDSAYGTASNLAQAGAAVTLLDARTDIPDSVSGLLNTCGVTLKTGAAVLNAAGKREVTGVELATANGSGWKPGGRENCDLLLVSGGWSPVVNLLSHRGVRPVWDAVNCCFSPAESPEPITCAGSAQGIWANSDCEDSGRAAADAAIATVSQQNTSVAMPAAGGWETPLQALYEVNVEGASKKSFIDPQHDVTADDVRLAHQEGFVSVEHLKRYTTLGMATDQGKMGNIIGLALMAEALGREIPEVGTTTFRPPYTPVSIGALAGRAFGSHFKPLRRTGMHDWNLEHGATMVDAGLWQRPWYFARAGETITEAYIRETTTTRTTVGLCDVTSLGKIAIQGPDATEFINRVYSNAFAKLPIGKARYGIMLRDDGIVMDDGTTWRFSETDYFMTTTTAHAAKVMVWLEELLQMRWPDLRVHVTSVSEQWAGVAVAGPKSRDVLAGALATPEAVSNEALPFMGVVETTLSNGAPCRIARISFSGEMAFEVYVGSDHANGMMDLLYPLAMEADGCLYGTEALGALRIEKGHVTGAELDGRVTIEDAGLGKMASETKSYIGSALRKRPALQEPNRPQLVGIYPKDRNETFKAGSILCMQGKVEGHGEGWITAVTHSPELGHWIGLGFIAGGYENWQGKTVVAADPVRRGNIDVEIVSPHMVDPTGERMHG
ncbi:MAG: sarcosine oxidase subunit alpha family protein [Pseudomonadota bacterium]